MSAPPETQEVEQPANVQASTAGIHVMQIMYFFLMAFIGAVALFFLRLPPIYSAILIGVAIGFVTFYALGGIKSTTKFSLGPVNVSGSLAAIAAATFGINFFLTKQIIDPQNAFPDARWFAMGSDLALVDSIQVGTWGRMRAPNLSPNRSTPLDLDKTGNDYRVSPSQWPNMSLGTVSRDTLDDLVQIAFPEAREDTYKTRYLNEFSRATGLDESGLNFPFYLETGRFNVSSFYYLKNKNTNEVLFEGNLRKNQYQVAPVAGKLYFITTAQVDHTLDRVAPNDSNYVQFIIGELKPEKEY